MAQEAIKSKDPVVTVKSRLEISLYWVICQKVRRSMSNFTPQELEDQIKTSLTSKYITASPWFKLKLAELRAINAKRLP